MTPKKKLKPWDKMSPEEIQTAMAQNYSDLCNPEILERVFEVVRRELGDTFVQPAVATAMVMAAGYAEKKNSGQVLNSGSAESLYLAGAKECLCQCAGCLHERAMAKKSADDMLGKVLKK